MTKVMTQEALHPGEAPGLRMAARGSLFDHILGRELHRAHGEPGRRASAELGWRVGGGVISMDISDVRLGIRLGMVEWWHLNIFDGLIMVIN